MMNAICISFCSFEKQECNMNIFAKLCLFIILILLIFLNALKHDKVQFPNHYTTLLATVKNTQKVFS